MASGGVKSWWLIYDRQQRWYFVLLIPLSGGIFHGESVESPAWLLIKPEIPEICLQKGLEQVYTSSYNLHYPNQENKDPTVLWPNPKYGNENMSELSILLAVGNMIFNWG